MTTIDLRAASADIQRQALSDIASLGSFTIARGTTYTRLAGTAWDPHDRARQSGTQAPSGRHGDYAQPYPDCTVRFDPAVAAEFAAFQASRRPSAPIPTRRGSRVVTGSLATHTSPCVECGRAFTQTRRRSTKRRWDTVCSGCKVHRRRRLTAERVKAHRARGRNASL